MGKSLLSEVKVCLIFYTHKKGYPKVYFETASTRFLFDYQ